MTRSIINCVLGATLFCATTAGADESAPAPQVTTEQVQAAIKKLEKLTGETLTGTGVPGIAIAIVHQDDFVYTQGFGVREAGQPEPIDAETVFQVASVSKPITSTVLATLVGEGHIGWDDRVVDHDPGFEMYEPYVTRELRLRDLLCHRSGLPDHAGDLLEDIGYDRRAILHRLRFQPPASSFRTAYAYTNFGYSEAAYAICGDESWDVLAAKTLFEPLGMKSTSYRFSDYAQAKNRALLHVRVDGKWTAKNTRQPDAQAPAGGVSTTLNDLVPWLRLQLNDGRHKGRQLVAADALAETRTPQIVTGFFPEQGRIVTYGLGWNVIVQRGGRVVCNHSGAFSLGMRTEVALLPDEKLGIAVLSNAAPTGVPEALVESFFDFVLDGRLERDWVQFMTRVFDEEVERELGQQTDYSHPPAQPGPPLPLAAYTGKYANDYFGTIELAEKQGQLILRLGPEPQQFELSHWDRDVFIYQPRGESAGGPAGVEFSIDPSGQAARVLIENLNTNGLGTFARANGGDAH